MSTVPRSGSYPDLSSAGSTDYIQRLFASEVLMQLYGNDVVSKITNDKAQNQSAIKKQGDAVTFRKEPTVTINNYSKGQSLVSETPTEDSVTLYVDKAKYFNIALDIIDKKQSDLDLLSMYAAAAAKSLKKSIAEAFLADVYDDGSSSNYGASAGVTSGSINMGTSGADLLVTKNSILDVFNKMALVLDEQDVKPENRHVTIPPSFWMLIQSSDLKNASFSGQALSSLIAQGKPVHNIAGFDVHVSTYVNSQTDGTTNRTAYDIIFNQEDAIAYCTQITKSQVLPFVDSSFESVVRGLAVYGYKVIEPKALGWLYASADV